MSDCGNVQKVFVPSSKEETKQLKPISGVEISDRAAERIKFFCKADNKDPEEFGLKVSVVKDGCSGNSYTMDYQMCLSNGTEKRSVPIIQSDD